MVNHKHFRYIYLNIYADLSYGKLKKEIKTTLVPDYL